MSKWDSFTGGREANARTQVKIDAHFAYQRRQRAHYVAIVLVILALCVTFSFIGA